MADRPERVLANPLVEAVQHFSLPQLMADPNRCRNVLNDIGADPAEVFLLVAALEARVPQTLMEHNATDDLSMVEPRLVAELNQRGIERSRAEWAVNAWKDVVSGSPLGQPTVIRSTEPATERATGAPTAPAVGSPTAPATGSPTAPATGAPATAAAAATERAAGAATERGAGAPTAPVTAPATGPAPPVLPPGTQRPTGPQPPGRRRRRTLIAVVVVAALVAAGAIAWVAQPDSKNKSRGTSAANLTAQLGPPTQVTIPASAAWISTKLTVKKGERINVAASGQIDFGGGQLCGPGGKDRGSPDPGSVIGGLHGAVIGLVAGSGLPFLVGANYNNVAPASGDLFLGINDTFLGDNSGHFNATVRVQQP